MKQQLYYLALLAVVLTTGCVPDKPVKTFAIDVVLVNPPSADANNNAFPADLKKLVQPIEDVGEPKTDIVLYPLTLKRADIDKKTELDYESNKSTNYKKIKAIERGLNSFFETAKVPSWLFLPQTPNFDITGYLNENKAAGNIFIYSESKFTVSGIQSFDDVKDLQTAIGAFVTNPEKKSSKLIVIYQPSGLKKDTLQPVGQKDSTVANSASAHTANKQASNASAASPVSQTAGAPRVVRTYSHVAMSSDLRQNMQSLVKGALNAEEKEVLKQAILKKFEPDAKVYLLKGDQVTRVDPIQRYLENLILTPQKISRIITIDNTKKFEDGKIYDIYIHEATNELP